MHRYIEFNAAKFLNDSREWEAGKKKLEEKREGITEIKGLDYSPVRSGRLHDSVAETAVARERIQAQIDRLERYQEAKAYAWERLSEAHKSVLAAFFFTGGYKSKTIRKYAVEHAMCLNQVYILRREALQEFARIIAGKFL